jgi:hypothetical protein
MLFESLEKAIAFKKENETGDRNHWRIVSENGSMLVDEFGWVYYKEE